MNTVTKLLQPVENDLDDLILELKNLIGAGHPILQAAAEHLFSAGGKRLRPGIVLLISKAISPEFCLTSKHKRLAEITEMIHTASLVHDDVVDEASTRRGVDTVHSRFNTRVAVLAGDFLFAQASWHLANLDNVNVVKLLSRVIMDLAEGEIKQNLNRFDSAQSFSKYINKSYCKTASLIANSCKAAGVLSGINDENLTSLYDFGKNIGLAFQVVDDILDFLRKKIDSSIKIIDPSEALIKKFNEAFIIPKTERYESISYDNVDFFVTSKKDEFYKKVKFWLEINKEISVVNLRSNV